MVGNPSDCSRFLPRTGSIKSDGTFCGQLGTGTIACKSSPALVGGTDNVDEVDLMIFTEDFGRVE